MKYYTQAVWLSRIAPGGERCPPVSVVDYLHHYRPTPGLVPELALFEGVAFRCDDHIAHLAARNCPFNFDRPTRLAVGDAFQWVTKHKVREYLDGLLVGWRLNGGVAQDL
jgi:hypothetical protein